MAAMAPETALEAAVDEEAAASSYFWAWRLLWRAIRYTVYVV